MAIRSFSWGIIVSSFANFKGSLPDKRAAALAACERAAERYPDVARFTFQRARALERLGRLAEAVHFYRLAADQGSPSAQVILGLMYMRGHGVANDNVEAVRLFRLAADQGLAIAQFGLGTMHEFGFMGMRSPKDAIEFYQQAARQGHADAQAALRRLNQTW